MRRLNEKGFSAEDNVLITLATINYWLEPRDKVLDFGCGSGAMACNLRQRGYSAFGFDLKDTLSQEAASHKEWFSFRDNDTKNKTNFVIDKARFTLPYENDSFDVIISVTTLEHVSDLDSVALELARITRPGGINLHVFPPKHCLVDCHLYVPLVTYAFFQRFWWFYFMALLGIRNEYQMGLSARETAKRNFNYSQEALFYRNDNRIISIFRKHFHTAYYADKFYYATEKHRPINLFRYLDALTQNGNLLFKLARAPMMKVLFSEK